MAGSKKVFTTLGSSNHALENRETFDYYATEPKAVEMLLELERFAPLIWDKTTPRLIQFHILKNAANPPFLGGFLFSSTVAA